MTLVADVLERDPRNNRLINNGQARLDGDDAEARGELASFVCEGRYANAFRTILDSFLSDLDRSSQQAAWVSGFFGSGKSHLLKMLALLWRNEPLDDGMTPRQLVSELPIDVRDQLAALDAEAKRRGGLMAAAASMPSGSYDRPRHAVLSIILKGAGLPGDIGRARFQLFLEERGIYDKVAHAIEAAGSTLKREIDDLFVSPLIAKALADNDPTLGSPKEVRDLLKASYRTPDIDIDKDAFVDVARRALKRCGEGGQIPLTLIVLDEVQIYIGDSSDRSGMIAEIAETLAKEFDKRVMLVGAGQSALTGVPQLARLLDRFTIRVQLDDNDVETVTRRVLLRKSASGRPEVEKTLDAHAAAVTRQLQNTKIAARPEDRKTAADDYPLLPVRRRFWDACFRAVDVSGTQSQLRSQLRILHDALGEVAGKELGGVVPADALYEALKPALVQSGVLPRDAYERVEKLSELYEADGPLAHRLAGVAFLISRLPDEAGADIGVRATPEHLADLLVDNLASDQGLFRERVRKLIDRMVDAGDLVRIGEELRIQTLEGRAWEQEFNSLRGQFQNDVAAFADERNRMLRDTLGQRLNQVSNRHGESHTPRKLIPAFFQDRAPERDEKNVPVWVRSEWDASDKEVRAEARKLGSDDGMIHVFIAKPAGSDLRDAVADMLAAQRTIDRRGDGHNDAAQDARRSMETRVERARARAIEIVDDLVEQATVLVGGGATVPGASLAARLNEANEIARKRLFPRFADADRPISDWTKVAASAREGADAPFAAIGHNGDPDTHPVGAEVLSYIGAVKSGADVRRRFEREPYGWPLDAIDAALLALTRAAKLSAILNGEPVRLANLRGPDIAKTSFRREETVIKAKDKIALKGLFAKAGIEAHSDDLGAAARQFLDRLTELARDAGGEAPLPKPPRLALEDEARGRIGNELLQFLLDHRSQLEDAIEERKARAGLRKPRLAAWERAQDMARFAEGLDGAKTAAQELEAVRKHCQLLEANDPLTAPTLKLRGLLVHALSSAHGALKARVAQALGELSRDPVWAALTQEQQAQILGECQLFEPGVPETGSDEAIIATLRARPLELWRSELDAVSGRQARAAEKAARVREPQVRPVHLERVTLRTTADVDAWLSRQRDRLIAALADGPALIS